MAFKLTIEVEPGPDEFDCGTCRFLRQDDKCTLFDEYVCSRLSQCVEAEKAAKEVK